MKLFSKRHNLYNDEAAKRRQIRGVVGGLIICAVMFLAVLETLLIMAR